MSWWPLVTWASCVSPFAESKESQKCSQQQPVNRHHHAILIHSTPYMLKNNCNILLSTPRYPKCRRSDQNVERSTVTSTPSSSIHLITSTLYYKQWEKSAVPRNSISNILSTSLFPNTVNCVLRSETRFTLTRDVIWKCKISWRILF